jgi:hypothetical protein
MKRFIISTILASLLLSFGAMAQSAKFTAVYDTSAEVVRSDACSSTVENFCEALNIGSNDSDEVATTIATIKVPQAKELLVGLSAQVSLWTSTIVKGKRGSYSRALAFAEGGVDLYACNQASGTCYEGQPGHVVLSNRSQELEAVLGGVIEECELELEVSEDLLTASGSFDLGDCSVANEAIGLALTTMAAHHFNFVFPNLPQGDYEVVAKLSTSAAAESEWNCGDIYDPCVLEGEEDPSATGQAYAFIGKHIMTVQVVRAVRGENGDPIVID